MYQLHSINSNEDGLSIIGYFQTYSEAENLKKLIELYSEAFDKYIVPSDQVNFTKLCRVQRHIELISGLKLTHLSKNETLEIIEIKTSSLPSTSFNLFEHNLKTFDKLRNPLYKEGDRVVIKGNPNGLGNQHSKYTSKLIVGTITYVGEYELGTTYMNVPEGFSYMVKSSSFEDHLCNEIWFHESNIEKV